MASFSFKDEREKSAQASPFWKPGPAARVHCITGSKEMELNHCARNLAGPTAMRGHTESWGPLVKALWFLRAEERGARKEGQ